MAQSLGRDNDGGEARQKKCEQHAVQQGIVIRNDKLAAAAQDREIAFDPDAQQCAQCPAQKRVYHIKYRG
jgi:hypothetical protein